MKRLIDLIFLLFVLSIASVSAQNKAVLEKKKNKLQKDIQYINNLLKDTETNKEKSLSYINGLQSKIALRTELIKTINNEIALLTNEISENQDSLEILKKTLETLKKQYGEMILQAYKSRSTNDQLLLIFSAEDLSQAYRRIRYLKQFNEYRKKKAEAIVRTGEKIENKLRTLEDAKTQKLAILKEEQEQNTKLLQERQEKESLVEKLKSKETELKASLEKKQKEKAQLDLEIKKIIEREIEEERKRRERELAKKREAEAKKSGTTTLPAPKTEALKAPALTPEAILASTNFEGNKGKLPWPVEKGIITGRFGTHPHPVFANIQIKNDGIDITTDKYANVRSVFEGTVSGIFNVTGYGKVVIVRHGEYLSVYSNLSETTVTKDQKIKTKDIIGKAGLNDEGSRSFINFQIRKGSVTQNPEHWLSR